MHYVISCGPRNTTGAHSSFAEWATAREAEGWHGIAVGDHLTSGGLWAHPFSALGAMAASTTRVRLMTAMVNNLLRSPVEVAQAALTLHHESGGRVDLGLGSGWQRDEIDAIGLTYPTPPIRAKRYLDAIHIVRDLLTTGRATAHNDHYDIDVDFGPPRIAPPTLVGAAAGPWLTKKVAPLVDRIEILPLPRTSAGGAMQLTELNGIDREQLKRTVNDIKDEAPHTAVSLLLFIAVGRPEHLARISAAFTGPLSSGLCGPASFVADTLHKLDHLGIDHVSLIPLTPDHERELADALH